ncbi:MAG: hypothetical protein ACOZDY_05570 [Pseudomonadota bacterium]
MLKWLGPKADHPMADLRDARKLIAEVPQGDALKALGELADWTASVAGTEGFKAPDRLEIYRLLDDAAQPAQRKLTRDFLTVVGVGPIQETRLAATVERFWTALADAYVAVFADPAALRAVPESAGNAALARGFRALAQRMKWHLLRYQPVDAVIWRGYVNLYRAADARRALGKPVELSAGGGQTTPERELLAGLMLWLSSPDGLTPQKIELAERIALSMAPMFRSAKTEGGIVTHYLDLDNPGPPSRVSPNAREKPNRVFVSAGDAWQSLPRLAEKIRKAGVPDDLGGSGVDAETLHDVIRHLERHWSPTPPVRQSARHRASAPIKVVAGFERAAQVLQGMEDALADKVQRWESENISAGGFSARTGKPSAERLHVGTVLAVQPEGAPAWGIGIVRRLVRSQPARVGVQTLGLEAQAVQVRVVGGQSTIMRSGWKADTAILFPLDDEGVVRAVLKAGLYAPTRSLEADMGGDTLLLMPAGLDERGEEYDLCRFKALEKKD